MSYDKTRSGDQRAGDDGRNHPPVDPLEASHQAKLTPHQTKSASPQTNSAPPQTSHVPSQSIPTPSQTYPAPPSYATSTRSQVPPAEEGHKPTPILPAYPGLVSRHPSKLKEDQKPCLPTPCYPVVQHGLPPGIETKMHQILPVHLQRYPQPDERVLQANTAHPNLTSYQGPPTYPMTPAYPGSPTYTMTTGQPGHNTYSVLPLQADPTSYSLRVPCEPHRRQQAMANDHHMSRSPEGQREPPPYPNQMLYQAGYRQSFSGSEASTDLSVSSLENLSMCSAVRQEPQGEETVAVVPSPSPVDLDLHYSQLLAQIAASMPATSMEVKSSNATFYVTASRPLSAGASSQSNSRTPSPNVYYKAPKVSTSASTNGRFLETGSSTSQRCSPVSLARQAPRICSSPQQGQGSRNSAGKEQAVWKKPDVNVASSWLVRHPASVQSTPTQLRRSYERLDRLPLTRSQPDLSRLNSDPGLDEGRSLQRFLQTNFDYVQKGQRTSQLDHATIASRATKLVETLSDENQVLRDQLTAYNNKVNKLHKLEIEIGRLAEQYQSLVQHSQKRENLERVLRFKLETELDKLRDLNNHLKDQLDKALSQLSQKEPLMESDNELKKELSKKNSVISKILAQNKELQSARERRDIEAAAQRSTLQEQRAHIQVLTSALTNAQSTISSLEEEARQKQGQQQKLQEMQASLNDIQKVAEKRQAVEERLREKLTEHIAQLRAKSNTSRKSEDNSTCAICSCNSNNERFTKMQEELDEKEKIILELESNALRWEQLYYEESSMRQMAIEAASMPKDARIAALEKSSQETEKMINEARNERLHHLQEVYEANKKTAQLEARVKSVEAQLAEKDAMIGVLQRHASLSRCSSVSSIIASPVHSPMHSLVSPIHTYSSRIHTPSSRHSPVQVRASSIAESVSSSSSSSSAVSVMLGKMLREGQSASSPASAASSRQGSQLDARSLPTSWLATHVKSNSAGGSTAEASPSLESQISELQQKLQTQAALLSGIQSQSQEQCKKFWQV